MHGIQALTTIPDPRRRRGRHYPLFGLLAIVLRAAITGNGRDAGCGCGRVRVRTTGSPFRPSACAPCDGFRAWRRAGLRYARRPPGTWSGRWSPAVGGTRSGP